LPTFVTVVIQAAIDPEETFDLFGRGVHARRGMPRAELEAIVDVSIAALPIRDQSAFRGNTLGRSATKAYAGHREVHAHSEIVEHQPGIG
jgi:hypothetical protein